MSARSELVGKSSSIWGHPRQIFPWARQMQNIAEILLISLGGSMGPIHPVWGHLVIFVWAGKYQRAPTLTASVFAICGQN